MIKFYTESKFQEGIDYEIEIDDTEKQKSERNATVTKLLHNITQIKNSLIKK